MSFFMNFPGIQCAISLLEGPTQSGGTEYHNRFHNVTLTNIHWYTERKRQSKQIMLIRQK